MNTVVKRFSDLKKRYDLNIQTTAVGYYHPSKKVTADKVVKRSRGRPAKSETGMTPGSVKKEAIRKHLDDEAAASNFEQFVNAETP